MDMRHGRCFEARPHRRASLDSRSGGRPGRHACLLDAGRHLGAAHSSTSTGIRVVAAVVVLLLVAAVLVVLARVGLWQQAFVSDRVIRFFAWALAAVFLLETLAAFTWSKEPEWWLYGPGLARDRTAGACRGGLDRSVAHLTGRTGR